MTQLTKIHGRSMEDRDKVQLNEYGQPIGDDEICRTISQFLGTLVRRSHFLPLTCPTWRDVPNEKDEIWDYVNEKYIVPDKGKKCVLDPVRDSSWRLYKDRLKKWTYKKYPTYGERIANCPKWIPKSDFTKWLKYLRRKKAKAMSKKNSENRKNNIKSEMHDLQLPSSGATNSPEMDNAHLGNFSPANGNGMS